MDVKKAVFLVEKLIENGSLNKNLSDIQELVFSQCWSGRSYQEIADDSGYNHDYIKQTGAKLWRALSLVLNTKVTKSNIHSVLRRYLQEQQQNELNTSNTVSQKLQETWCEVKSQKSKVKS
ncbi:MAG: hypothetical protein QNJ53_22515 [Pleurocapsa sp. MO_192.B19]|nr:hypothetical protein [Pleurocapsa sp. MO_192.B19]